MPNFSLQDIRYIEHMRNIGDEIMNLLNEYEALEFHLLNTPNIERKRNLNVEKTNLERVIIVKLRKHLGLLK